MKISGVKQIIKQKQFFRIRNFPTLEQESFNNGICMIKL